MKAREPRGHWLLLLLGGLTLGLALLLTGFAAGAIGESPQYTGGPDRGPAPPEAVTGGGPVLNLAGGDPRTARPAARTIALTFDDGPDPEWTPQLLDVLRAHKAKATFFVMGSNVAEHPGLARRMADEGHEIGSHTYTHIDMGVAPAWRVRLELDLTQRALAGAAGIKTRLLRMPYSSTPEAVTGTQWRGARLAAEQGYLIAFTDLDTRDWEHATVDQIVGRATPGKAGKGRRAAGAVVMLHDSGGNRAATVAAVDRMLTRLSGEGYRFTTLSQAVGLPYATVRAGASERAIGKVLVVAQLGSGWIVRTLTLLFSVAAVLTLLRLATLLLFAKLHVRRVRRGPAPGRAARRQRTWREIGLLPPPLSVVVPAYNEEAGIAATVWSLLDTDYPGPVEVIVVDDGSADRTADIVAGLDLPRVRLVRKPNGGKPSALNVGVGMAASELVVLVDGDTVFQRDTLWHLVAPFTDPSVGAVSGNTKVANRGGVLGRWQHIEYVIGFNLDRRMFDMLECMPTIPGAIGAFRRQVLASVGGVSDDTLAEDTDLTMAICQAGWRVVYEEKALAWTEAPSSLRQLWRQRYRWCYGTLQAMWKHKGSVLRRGRPGRFGRRCLTYLAVFQVALPVFAPAVDLFTLYGVFFIDPARVAVIWLVFALAQALAGAYALRLDGERIRPLWVLPLQQVVYRQLMYLVVIQSLVTAMLGARLRWHTIRRTGTFSSPGARGTASTWTG